MASSSPPHGPRLWDFPIWSPNTLPFIIRCDSLYNQLCVQSVPRLSCTAGVHTLSHSTEEKVGRTLWRNQQNVQDPIFISMKFNQHRSFPCVYQERGSAQCTGRWLNQGDSGATLREIGFGFFFPCEGEQPPAAEPVCTMVATCSILEASSSHFEIRLVIYVYFCCIRDCKFYSLWKCFDSKLTKSWGPPLITICYTKLPPGKS